MLYRIFVIMILKSVVQCNVNMVDTYLSGVKNHDFYTNSSKLDKWYIRILRGSLFHLTVMGMTKMYPLWNDNKIKLLHLNRLTSCISDFVLWVKQIQILCTFAQGLTTLLFLFQNIWSRPNINYAPNNVPKDNFLLLHKLRSQK